MRTRSIALMVVLVVSSSSLGEDAGEASKKLQGTWRPKAAEQGGKAWSDEMLKSIKLIIKDDTYTVTTGTGTDQGTVKIDPSMKPKSMDIIGAEGPNKGKTILAIYELAGDNLKVCYDLSGKKRPTEFKTKKGSPLFFATYKRE
jgi:uncharacterized protein (TIGR03067 family)